MSKSKRKNTVKKVVIIVVALIFIIIAAAVIYVYVISPLMEQSSSTATNTSPISVTLDGTTYQKDATIFLYDEYTVFDVDTENAFTVEIVPDPDVKFDYFIDGQNNRFSDVENLFEVFGVNYTESGFSINPPSGDIIDILAKYHNVGSYLIEADRDLSQYKSFFVIRIKTSDNTLTLSCILGSRVDKVELDYNTIIL